MTEIARYRGTQRLAAPALARLALQIVHEMAVFGPGALRNLEVQAEALGAVGVGSGEGGRGGYEQILAMTAGLLLVGAGASVGSAADTVRARSAATLEALIANVLARLRAAPPADRQEPPASGSVPPASPTPLPRQIESAGHPAVASPEDGQSPPVDESMVFGDGGSTPLAFLRSRFDDGLRRVVRNAHRAPGATTGEDPVSPGSPVSAPLDRAAAAHAAASLEFVPGMAVTIAPELEAQLSNPAARAEVIRAFAVALERRFR